MDPILLPILLMLAGFVCVLMDFFLPTGGVLSFLGAIAIVAAIILGFIEGSTFGLILLVSTAIVLPFLFAVAIKFWPHTPLGRLILIQRPKDEDVLPEPIRDHRLEMLIGRHGVAKCKMLPGGAVRVEGKTYDAVSDGIPIENDEYIEVVAVRNNRLVVRPIQKPQLVEETDEDDLLARPADSVGIDATDDPLA